MLADQRANPLSFAPHCIKRVETCGLYVELSTRILIEQTKRSLRRSIPDAIDGTGMAADPEQLG